MSRLQIEAREQLWRDAFNSGDASGVARLYSEDGRVLPPNAELIQGRAAVEAFLKEFLQIGPSIRFEVLTVHESPDLCAVVGRYELAFQPPGAEPQNDVGKFVEVWRRQPDGEWLLAEDIFNSDLPAAA